MGKFDELKDRLWYWTRYCFWIMIILWAIAIPIPEDTYGTISGIIFSILWFGITIVVFVLSIQHLCKYEKRAFAITALVLSSWLLLTFLIGIIIGLLRMV